MRGYKARAGQHYYKNLDDHLDGHQSYSNSTSKNFVPLSAPKIIFKTLQWHPESARKILKNPNPKNSSRMSPGLSTPAQIPERSLMKTWTLTASPK